VRWKCWAAGGTRSREGTPHHCQGALHASLFALQACSSTARDTFFATSILRLKVTKNVYLAEEREASKKSEE